MLQIFRRSRRRMGQWLTSSLVVLLLTSAYAFGGTLSMDVRTVATESNLFVHVVNRGDEAAKNVSARLECFGHTISGPVIETMEPNQPRVLPVNIPTSGFNGTYPAIVLLGFEDLNGYPFSSVSVTTIRSPDAQTSPLMAVFDPVKVRGRTEVPLRIRNEADYPVTANYRVIVPRELIIENGEGTVVVPARGQAQIAVTIENFSAMNGSSYAVQAILEHDRDGLHYTANIGSVLQVFAASSTRSSSFWVVVGAVVVVLVVVVLVQRRRSRRSRP
ncbi:MAG: hypothetical protein O3A51_12100 [Verrucomicrobia bacterium]|nr:hypothetical protein [Verrucomicrobiota bacterium]